MMGAPGTAVPESDRDDSAVAWVDGGARGNPGEAGCGIVIEFASGIREEHGIYLGPTTNNVAEYAALVAALEHALARHVIALEVRADSELVVRQMRGEYRVKAPHLQPLWLRAQSLVRRLQRFAITHVPRSANAAADRLANAAIDRRQSTLPRPDGLP